MPFDLAELSVGELRSSDCIRDEAKCSGSVPTQLALVPDQGCNGDRIRLALSRRGAGRAWGTFLRPMLQMNTTKTVTSEPVHQRSQHADMMRRALEQSALYSEELGIELARGTDAVCFRWFLASLLFGARISETIAKKTFRAFIRHGLTTPTKIVCGIHCNADTDSGARRTAIR